jgi:hypothetical protein
MEGLISYGPHRPDLYRRTAGYVDMIPKGANPDDLVPALMSISIIVAGTRC